MGLNPGVGGRLDRLSRKRRRDGGASAAELPASAFDNDPIHQEKLVKFNELLANIVIYSTACDITAAANAIAAEEHPVDPDDLATSSPYITENVRRFGEYVLDLAPPDDLPDTRLGLVPGALFPPSG